MLRGANAAEDGGGRIRPVHQDALSQFQLEVLWIENGLIPEIQNRFPRNSSLRNSSAETLTAVLWSAAGRRRSRLRLAARLTHHPGALIGKDIRPHSWQWR